ncbi:MAG: SAM-dependent methyltransferase [Acidobacteria bacterium]|nr:SAM-dependent methyltransferase [Acidobacteriota bacterium]
MKTANLLDFMAPEQAAAAEAKAEERTVRDLSQWFTPFWAAEELMAHALEEKKAHFVLEPSCGSGSFLTAIPSDLDALGVEIDPVAAEKARTNSQRRVIIGNFKTVDLEGFEPDLVIGNPPFDVATISAFVDRAGRILPDDGMIAMILPAYAFQTPSRVTEWMDAYSLDIDALPRTLFPGLSKPLVWARFRKTAQRLHRGLLLFRRTRAIEEADKNVKGALGAAGTWRNAVDQALRSVGGKAHLRTIYDRIDPQRRASEHWQPKVRQTLQRGFTSLGNGVWALPEAA